MEVKNLSQADRSRLTLIRVAESNPGSIPTILNSIKELADEALRGTLDVAQREALTILKNKIDIIEKKYEKGLSQILGSIDSMLQKKVDALVLPKGDKGDAPSKEELLDLIEMCMPEVEDGKDAEPPTPEELTNALRPIFLEYMSSDSILSKLLEDHGKKVTDAVYGKVVNMIAGEIVKLKRVGGGYAGDRVKAGAGITIRMNSIGQKEIIASGAGSVSTPTGTVNGSNATFTLTDGTPKWIVADGITYYENAGYSISGTTLTMDIAPSQFIRAVR